MKIYAEVHGMVGFIGLAIAALILSVGIYVGLLFLRKRVRLSDSIVIEPIIAVLIFSPFAALSALDRYATQHRILTFDQAYGTMQNLTGCRQLNYKDPESGSIYDTQQFRIEGIFDKGYKVNVTDLETKRQSIMRRRYLEGLSKFIEVTHVECPTPGTSN